MPSFRDLKGHPLEEEVTSRSVAAPPPSSPPVEGADAAAIREQVKLVAARRASASGSPGVPVTGFVPAPTSDPASPLFAPPGQPWPGDEHLVPVSVAAARFAQMAALPPLPADFEKGLEDLESTLASIVKATNRVTEGVQTATHQIAALRLRAQQDQAALSRLQAIQEALKG